MRRGTAHEKEIGGQRMTDKGMREISMTEKRLLAQKAFTTQERKTEVKITNAPLKHT
jgi:hypothetical protein